MQLKVALALGSGGLRGLAHIGVLRILTRYGVPVDYVAGCSIGALIGSLYCTGLDSETIRKIAVTLKRRHWLDFVIPKLGLIAGDRTLEMLRLLTRGKAFADLDIPLAVVATDLCQGNEIVFREGDVASAVRASISVPGIFQPFKMKDRTLIDGAVVNPTPVDVARLMGGDIVIGVDLVHAGSVCNFDNIFDVILQSIDIVERQLAKQRQTDCDILIQPEVAQFSPSSFDRIDECIEAGEKATEAVMPQIMELLKRTEYIRANEENPSLRNGADNLAR